MIRPMSSVADVRAESYGESGLTPVDRLGVWLSQRAIVPHVTPGCRVLDLGCGYDASLLRSLAPRIGSGTGIDVSVGAEARATDGLSFAEGTLEEAMPRLEDGAYDLVCLISVLEHVWEPLDVLSECRRVLAEDGTLLINVPTWLGKGALELSAFRLHTSPAIEMDDHKNYYDRRDLWPLLVRAGFAPHNIRLRRHKLGLNLFAVARRGT
jgi:SAM-dependent methyltransferase